MSYLVKSTMTEALLRLREMTERIPEGNPYFYDRDKVVHLITKAGKAKSYGIHKEKHISIARTEFSKGAILATHKHSQKEVIHVLSGQLIITLFDPLPHEVTLNQYESLEIDPGIKHSSIALLPTIIIALTMPYSPNFPVPNNGKKSDNQQAQG